MKQHVGDRSDTDAGKLLGNTPADTAQLRNWNVL